MALTPNCPTCGSASSNFIFLRNGVPVDTSDGTVALDPFTCSDLAGCSLTDFDEIPAFPTTAGTYQLNYDQATNTFAWVLSSTNPPMVQAIGGTFILDPGELNSWGQFGFGDETGNVDLGNVGATTLPQTAGGFTFPFDVLFDAIQLDYRENATDVADEWGFFLAHGTPPLDGSAIPITYLLDDLGDGNSRLANDTQVRRFDFSPAGATVIPAGDLIVLGVQGGAALDQASNRRVEIPRGWFQVTPV